MSSFKKSFLKNIFVSGGFTYLTQLVIFIASFVTSRLLSPKDFGLVGLITVFSGFITIFSDSGISMAVIRSNYTKRYYRGLHFVSFFIGIILTLLTLLFIYPISIFYSNSEIILPGIAIAFLFTIRSLSIVPMAILQKELRFAASGSILFISTVAGTMGTIVLAFAGFKSWSLVWPQYLTAVVSFIILYNKSTYLFIRPKLAVIRKSFLLAKTLIGSLTGFNMINYWARNADNLIVGKYYGTNDLGIYNRAYMMLQMPLNLITGIFSSVLLPSFVKHKNSGGDVEQEYYFILKIISLLNLPVATILLLFPKKLVLLLWGENWIAVAQLLPYFGLLIMTQTLTSTLGNLLVVENKEKTLMITGWISSVFMVAGIIIGSLYSLTSIAAYYTLAFIVLVLPFSVIYVFIFRLRFIKGIYTFWIPRILLSLIVWVAIYKNIYFMVVAGMIIWILMVLLDSRPELKIVLHNYMKRPA